MVAVMVVVVVAGEVAISEYVWVGRAGRVGRVGRVGG